MEQVDWRPTGHFEDLKVIRMKADILTVRLCQLFDMPEQTWRRSQAKGPHRGLPSRHNGGDNHNKTLQTPNW